MKCLMVRISQDSNNDNSCNVCHSFYCSCNGLPRQNKGEDLDSEINISTKNYIPDSNSLEVFPPSSSDLSQRSDIKPMQIISNLEVSL